MSNNLQAQENVIDIIFDLFRERGATEYMGEAVTMSQHMEQTAACAVEDAATDSQIIAALLHDIGHFVGDHPIDALEQGNDNFHDEVGANFLKPYFPPSVTEPIRLHVAAKRYLCATDETYLGHLSSASVNSLRVQGGPMTSDEVRQFETNRYYQQAVKVRLYDDDGKVEGLTIKPVYEYRQLMQSLLMKNERAQ